MEGLPLDTKKPIDATSVLISEAITTGDTDFIKSLLQEENIFANGKNHSCWLLYEAIESKNTEIVSTLLEYGVCVEACSSVKSPNSALHEAVNQGCVSIIKELILYKASWKNVTKNGDTVLHLAFNNNYLYNNYVTTEKRAEMKAKSEEIIIEIIKLFLDDGMDLNIKNRIKRTPLFLAASHKMINVAKYLLERGAKVSNELFIHSLVFDELESFGREKGPGTWDLKHIRHIKQDNVEFLDWFLSQGFNVDHKNDEGKTPLQLAVERNQVYLLPTLLKYANDLTFQCLDRSSTILHILLKSNPINKNVTGGTMMDLLSRNQPQDIDEAAKLMIDKGISMDSGRPASCVIAAQQKRTNLLIFMLNHKNGTKVVDLILPVVEDWINNIDNQLSPGIDEVFSILISDGVLLRWQVEFQMMLLLCAVEHKFNKTLEAWRKHGIDTQLSSVQKEKLLHIALKDHPSLINSSKISEDSVRFIIELGCDVNGKTLGNRTPLHEAVSSGNLGALKVLIENGAAVNTIDVDGKTPLHLAVSRVNVYPADCPICQRHDDFDNIKMTEDIVRCLIEKGCDLNCKASEGMTPLHEVALSGNVELARILIENGADINAKQRHGKTPLHLAAITRGPRDTKVTEHIVKLLIEKDCDVNSKSNDGSTPLHNAAAFGQVKSVKILIDNNANIEEKDEVYGYTPFLMAARNAFNEVVDILIKERADVNVRDCYGLSALHLAIGAKIEAHMESFVENMVKLIIERGCNVNHKSENGTTALHLAASMGKVVIVKILIKNGANVNAKDSPNERTPLHLAASKNFSNVAQVLTGSGADVNARLSGGETPMHLAIVDRCNEILETLLELGGDADITNEHSCTPLELALTLNAKEAVKVLLEFAVDFTNIRAILIPTSTSCNDAWELLFQCFVKLEVICLPYPRVHQTRVNWYAGGKLHLAFKAECQKLKQFLMSKTVTLYEFLHMYPVERYIYTQQADLKLLVISKFPLYRDIILASYRDAIAREALRKAAKTGWFELTGIHLVDKCINCILDHCTVKSLKILATWTKESNLKRTKQSKYVYPAKKNLFSKYQ